MKKLLVSVLGVFLFLFAGVSFLSVQASNNINVTMTGIFDGGTLPNDPVSVAFGSKVSLDPIVPSNHAFAFWIVNGIVRIDLDIDYQFTITSRMNLQAVFYRNGENPKHVVVFIDQNGAYLGHDYVVNGESANDSGIALPERPGYLAVEGSNRWIRVVGSTSTNTVTQNSVFKQRYVIDGDLSDVTIFVTDAVKTNAEEVYSFNSVVNITAATHATDTFRYWTENGNIVSYDLEYTFTALTDREIVAVYGSAISKPLVFVSLSKDLELRNGYHTYVGQFRVEESVEMIEYGFIFGTEAVELSLENASQIVQGTNHNLLTNEFVTSFPIESHLSIRAYIRFKIGETIQTEYSDVNHRYLGQNYFESFEGLSNWASYPTSDSLRTFDGLSWTIKEVLLNPDANDLSSSNPTIHGSKMLRFRGANTAYAYTNDYLDYVNFVSFDAKYYNETNAASVMRVWKQVYGEEWLQVAQVTLTGIYTNHKYYINESNVRIKVTVDTRTANIDNLRIDGLYKGEIFEVTTNSDGNISTFLAASGKKIIPPITSKNGYTFDGWYNNPDYSGSAFDFNQQITSSIELYAKFSINQYSISFVSNGGSAVSQITQDFESSVLAPTNPTRTGYTFAGWFSNIELTNFYVFDTMPAQNTTLYAKWDINSYNITFNSNGGSSIDPITQSFGTAVVAPTQPTKEGYTFIRWYLTDPEVAYIFTTMPAENITLNALWAEISSNEYTVSFETYDGSSVPDQTIIENQKVTEPTDPIWSGYDFDGWFTSGDFITQYDFDNLVISSFTLYAKWTELHTVTFETNGGSSISPVYIRNGQTLNPVPTPTRSGYTFEGWYTSDELSVLFNPSNPIEISLTIYAKWDLNQTVLFKDLLGTTGNPPTGWTYFGLGSAYADTSLKMDNTGDYIITESFTLVKQANFILDYKGNTFSGGSISFYDQNDNLLHTASGLNANTRGEIIFSINSSVNRVKIVYSKVSGNIGIYDVTVVYPNP